MEKSCIDLGFVDEPENPWSLHRAYFPSKFGGKPAWLNPKDLPNADKLCCSNCAEVCIFLLQLYAPDEEMDEAFHRTLLVFCCKNTKCYKETSKCPFVILRCCLPQTNSYYPPTAPDYNSEAASKSLKPVEDFCNVCEVCGCRADKKCSGCNKVSYCQRSHQVADWKLHKITCKGLPHNGDIPKMSKLIFQEMEIVMENCSVECYSDKSEHESDNDADNECESDIRPSASEELETVLKNGSPSMQGVSKDELVKCLTNEGTNDLNYQNFSKSIKSNPDQVIRYDRGGLPLQCSKQCPSDIEPCQCGSERQFEFQIMPQLLCEMKVDTSIEGDTIDWGTVMVFTCKANCCTDPYSLELAYKQHFDGNETAASKI